MITDPLEAEAGASGTEEAPRQRYLLEDTGFDEVPKKYRRFYRKWKGPGDSLGPNEVLCPVCKVVIRSTRDLREGDRVYCMPCRPATRKSTEPSVVAAGRWPRPTRS